MLQLWTFASIFYPWSGAKSSPEYLRLRPWSGTRLCGERKGDLFVNVSDLENSALDYFSVIQILGGSVKKGAHERGCRRALPSVGRAEPDSGQSYSLFFLFFLP
jgi:hypothetical protein